MAKWKDWTNADLAKLRELWDKGLPTAEIGRRLGVSKNAVVGKAHRLELKPRPSPVKKLTHEQRGARDAEVARRLARISAKKPTLSDLSTPEAIPAKANRDRIAADANREQRRASVPRSHNGNFVDVAMNARIAARAKTAPQPAPPVPAPLPAPEPKPASAKPVGRVRPCAWVIGNTDKRDFRTCGEPVEPGMPYCLAHCRICYVNYQPKAALDADGNP